MSLQLVEAIVLPMTHKDRFKNIGIHPPKGLYTLASLSLLLCSRPRGLMDKASDFESEDWGFESLRGRFFYSLFFTDIIIFFFFCRCAVVWSSWYRKDSFGKSLCSSDKSVCLHWLFNLSLNCCFSLQSTFLKLAGPQLVQVCHCVLLNV